MENFSHSKFYVLFTKLTCLSLHNPNHRSLTFNCGIQQCFVYDVRIYEMQPNGDMSATTCNISSFIKYNCRYQCNLYFIVGCVVSESHIIDCTLAPCLMYRWCTYIEWLSWVFMQFESLSYLIYEIWLLLCVLKQWRCKSYQNDGTYVYF